MDLHDPHTVKVLALHRMKPESTWPEHYHEWVFIGYPGGDVELRDALGRRHRHAWRRWHVARCNNGGCEGRLLVREDAIERLLDEAYPAPV